MIYLDNAATTVGKPEQVINAVVKAMTTMGNASRGTNSGAMLAAETVYDARTKIADMFGCKKAEHVVFTSNITEALNTAINGTIKSGDQVITTDLEHNSVLRPLYALERGSGGSERVSLSFLKADRSGNVDYSDLPGLLTDRTRAIVCTHASNLTGNMIDIKRVGRFARENGLLFIVDSAQTAGAFSIDMEEMNIDILCFTGHKGLMGPQGTGGLCIGNGIEIEPLKSGGTGVHSYERYQPEEYPARLEAGTLNSHGIAGLSAAVDFIRETGMDTIREKEEKLMRRFYANVSEIPGVKVYGDYDAPHRAPITLLNIGNCGSGIIADILSESYGIAVRPGAHCAPRMHEALGTKEQGAVRFSFSWFNTNEEIDIAAEAVKEIAGQIV
jgi:cysteine desulfurase family protein